MSSPLRRVLRFFAAREWSVFFILCLEILMFYLILEFRYGWGDTFINLNNFSLIFRYSSIYVIAAVGSAMIIIAGGIDLAPGSVIALVSVVTGYFYVNTDQPLWLACLAGLTVGLLCGLLVSFLIVYIQIPRQMQQRLPAYMARPLGLILEIELPPFIATLGVGLLIARGIAFIIMKGKTYIDLSAKLPRDMEILGISSLSWFNAAPVVLMIIIPIFFHWFMVRTRWGRQIHAVGGNQQAAYFSGVKVGWMKTIVYVAGAVLAAVSGIIMAVIFGQGSQNLALGYELDFIAAAVVGGASLAGGKGSVLGAMIGALIFGVLHNGLNHIPGAAYYERFIVGLAVVIIVVIDQITVRRQRRLS
jgi:ribose/xylose/arabinose/galactoside ABC-type transport system permease subunit